MLRSSFASCQFLCFSGEVLHKMDSDGWLKRKNEKTQIFCKFSIDKLQKTYYNNDIQSIFCRWNPMEIEIPCAKNCIREPRSKENPR